MKIEKLGMWASVACIVHCCLPLTIPVLAGVVSHDVEMVLWSLSGLAGLLHARKVRGVLRWSLVVTVIVGTFGAISHNHEALHVGFLGVAMWMIFVMVRQHRREAACAH